MPRPQTLHPLKQPLEELYRTYNHRRFVPPDPLQYVYGFEDARDREIAGLIASSLAFGNVKQIVRSTGTVLSRMERPAEYVAHATAGSLCTEFAGFRHRFVAVEQLSAMLLGVRRVIERHGSLGDCFRAGLREDAPDLRDALARFVAALRQDGGGQRNFLLPSPERKSACKRLNLFLRWMVRRDNVDPGVWTGVPASKLIVPLDTHMFRIAQRLAWTRRKRPDLLAALEITGALRRICPEDPLRYDFALTRLGIRPEGDMERFLRACRARIAPP